METSLFSALPKYIPYASFDSLFVFAVNVGKKYNSSDASGHFMELCCTFDNSVKQLYPYQ